jgi:hypothetical protein
MTAPESRWLPGQRSSWLVARSDRILSLPNPPRFRPTIYLSHPLRMQPPPMARKKRMQPPTCRANGGTCLSPRPLTLRLAVAGNPTITSARATLEAAKEAVIVARAGYLPKIDAAAGAQRSGGGPLPDSTQASYLLGLNASYTFGAFGGATRRLVEQQQAFGR